MALATTVRFDVIDVKGKTSFTKVRIPSSFSLVSMTEFAVAMAQLIANATTGRITRVSISFNVDLSGATIKAVASGLSDIAQKALLGFSTIVSGFRTKLKIPAISEVKFVTGTDQLDLADVDVAAFINAMENGVVVTGGTISPTDLRGNDVQTLDYARELFRKK